MKEFLIHWRPTILWALAAQDYVLAVAYAGTKDWRWATYWFAAGVICSVVPK